MSDHFDALETRSPEERERHLFDRLPGFLTAAAVAAPGLGRWLAGIDLAGIVDRDALSSLPVLRKAALMEFQRAEPPFGGFAGPAAWIGSRLFQSPGPLWEPQPAGADPWQAARAFYAAGVRRGDLVHNAFSYHMTPGGFILDEGARALGCMVFPAGTGSSDLQIEAAAALRPSVYCGTPDFLKVILDRAAELGRDVSSFKRALVSGGALFPSLRSLYAESGVAVMQCYATAEFGVVAYETTAADGSVNPGMVVNENLIVEIVRPGTGDPLPEGQAGELVVTSLNPDYPLVRFGTGDLSAFLPGPSPCGRTNKRIAGWLGRADQRTKIKGMFVDPAQIAALLKRHPEIARARLIVGRDGDRDAMVLKVEPTRDRLPDEAAIAVSLSEATGLSGRVQTVAAGSLPNDGKVISDERDYSA